jgi:hypothetical protein
MPILHKCEQYSDEYDRLKLGIPTSSNFDKIISPEGKPSKQWKKYAYHLIAERLLDRQVDSYTSPYMERGLALESDAAEFYEMLRDQPLERVGFITNDDASIGCSPDRLIGEDGLLEIKVPAPQTQVEYLLTGEIDRKYWPQLQGQLFISERKFVDIISYHPELPPSIISVERDDVFIACLENLLWEFNSFLREVMAKIATMRNLQKGQPHEQPQIQF